MKDVWICVSMLTITALVWSDIYKYDITTTGLVEHKHNIESFKQTA